MPGGLNQEPNLTGVLEGNSARPEGQGPGARLAYGLTSQREIPASAGSHQHPASTQATPQPDHPAHRAAARPRRRPPDRHFHASATSPPGHQDLHAMHASAAATTRTSAGSAGLGAVTAVRAVHLAQDPLGEIMAVSWRPRVLRTIARLTENHRPAASASSAIAATPLCQWSTARPAAHYEPRSSATTTSRISAQQHSKSA